MNEHLPTEELKELVEQSRVKVSGSLTVSFPSGSVTLRMDNVHASEVLGFFDVLREYFCRLTHFPAETGLYAS